MKRTYSLLPDVRRVMLYIKMPAFRSILLVFSCLTLAVFSKATDNLVDALDKVSTALRSEKVRAEPECENQRVSLQAMIPLKPGFGGIIFAVDFWMRGHQRETPGHCRAWSVVL